ncbi:IS66 family transposase zinc-finger binding domain-containing protein, partial [Geofilum sp. OHC36d9]|uniref:IS66 family transposase n=1 Tax=Geofilum sp. OHC36d9 TaxID=3458413 RepID=UPI0040346B61
MNDQQNNNSFSTNSLKAKIAILENKLAEKDSVIAERDSAINKLAIDLDAARFQNEQLRRMIFGSKRERFESKIDSSQLILEFEPKAAEIEEAVEAERELIKVAYERKKPEKKHHGRLVLPSHLPVVETIIEPSEDTTDMVCIGREITEELDYTPAKLHINRIIRPKYITKEDERGNQKQVIAELNRPIAKCIASTALLTMIFINKYIYHLPLYRT